MALTKEDAFVQSYNFMVMLEIDFGIDCTQQKKQINDLIFKHTEQHNVEALRARIKEVKANG